MLRKIISIPEGVYYRGRFRATIAWSKVSRRRGEGDSPAADVGASQAINEPDRLLQERALPARTKPSGLQVRPAGS
jgi:hypothetical protein